MKARFAKYDLVARLKNSIHENLDWYRDGYFSLFFSEDNVREIATYYVDTTLLATILPPEGKDFKDVENSNIVYQALQGITPYIAKDERLLVYLSHMDCIDYVRARWPIPDNDEHAVKRIRDHFFAVSDRGFKRNNAISRLWWNGHMAFKCSDAPITKVLEVLVSYTDVREQVVGRPTTSNSNAVFSAIMRVLISKYDAKESDFFKRAGSDAPYRRLMRKLNEHGGLKLLDSMSAQDLDEELKDILATI